MLSTPSPRPDCGKTQNHTTVPRQNSRKNLLAGLSISVVIHAVLIIVFLSVSMRSAPTKNVKKPPKTTLIPVVEPLKVEPIEAAPIDPLIMDTPSLDAKASEPLLPDGILAGQGSDIAIAAEGAENTLPASFTTTKPAYKSSFCGARGIGNRICYVVDSSGSMIIAFDYIRSELSKSIKKLSPAHYFQVVFFAGSTPIELNSGKMVRASMPNRKKALKFIKNKTLSNVGSKTQAWKSVVNALQKAFQAKSFDGKRAQQIYLLTDGEFDHKKVESAVIKLQNGRSIAVKISVIACGNRDNEKFLKKLSRKYKGHYRFVSDSEMAGAILD